MRLKVEVRLKVTYFAVKQFVVKVHHKLRSSYVWRMRKLLEKVSLVFKSSKSSSYRDVRDQRREAITITQGYKSVANSETDSILVVIKGALNSRPAVP